MNDKNINILLVEDDDIDREAVRRYIGKNQLPYTIQTAESYSGVIDRLQQSTFDVVLLDYQLGAHTGFEILPLIGNTPAIFVTGSGSEGIAAQAMRQGAEDYLIKDPDRNYLEVLPATIENVLNKKQMQVALQESEDKNKRLNLLKEKLLSPGTLEEKLKHITNGVIEIFNADFARIWIRRHGDLCDSGCLHAKVTDGPHVCRDKDNCLHLIASSGRYTHINGELHCRIPFDCYKIGRIASGEESKFITNNVVMDQRIHDQEWAAGLALVSFAGYRLLSAQARPIGVLALFSKNTISPTENTLLEGLANNTTQVIQTKMAEEALNASKERLDSIVRTVPDIIYRIDTDGRITFISDSVKRYGYKPKELLGINFLEIVHPEDKEQAVNRINDRRTGDRSTKLFEVKLLMNNQSPGSLEFFSISAEGLYSSKKPLSSNFLGTQGIARNITKKKQAEKEREKLIGELQEALGRVKTLSGLLPICSECKKIRDDKGYWNQIEVYVRDHSEADFSHGICPECMDNLYGDQDWYNK